VTVAEHLVVLTVLGAPGRAVSRAELEAEFPTDVLLGAMWHGPLYERWAADVTRGTEVYYAGPHAATTRPVGVFR
jgi:hypothetical protein